MTGTTALVRRRVGIMMRVLFGKLDVPSAFYIRIADNTPEADQDRRLRATESPDHPDHP
jgi:hypothetical protein